MDKLKVLGEIKKFLEGYNDDLKYIVNVETDNSTNYANCIIHKPNSPMRIEEIKYEPFIYMKDLSKLNLELYKNNSKEMIDNKRIKYGIDIIKLNTGNQKRLIDGFCYLITSSKSYNCIINYLRDGGLDPYEKEMDYDGNLVRNEKGEIIYKNRDLFYSPRTTEQFFISTQTRIFKGFEEYKDVLRLTVDIETTGLKYQVSRIISIGVRTNKGFETILNADKPNDDESEIRLIQDLFNLIDYIKPAVISGHNIEGFDFEFILGRANELKMNLDALPTSLNKNHPIKRKPNATVKHGSTSERYTSTIMWGYSINDTIHSAKRTAAINSDIKEVGLKYLAKYEKVAKENRIYIKGEDNTIGKYYNENKMFLIDNKNTYIQIPNEFQETGLCLYRLQKNKSNLNDVEYNESRKKCLGENKEFVNWFRNDALSKNLLNFITGKELVERYLLDDLYETEQIDELYNQSSFMLAKIIPTTFQRICTMGTAAIWNLLMTAWSYENNLAIPESDDNERFSGGLARCFKTGYSERIIKIDYASLYPMIQLTEDVFPMFDITGVLKKFLLYLTTTRNIYKKMANGTQLNNNETMLLQQIDPDVYEKHMKNELSNANISMFKIKQLPIKILNNSLFGALGSNISFNWSDNICAARITCTGRLHLRHAINWFSQYGCIPLLAVTDGINFSYPEKTKIRLINDVFVDEIDEKPIEEMWNFNNKMGISALIEKYNKEVEFFNIKIGKENYISVDDDGKSTSCLNLSRINYATLAPIKDKKTGELKEKIKLVGNTIKSKTMPEYIEEFIDKALDLILHGKGKEFVDYYQSYVEDIRYMQIPLKKIANKSRIKSTISAYKKRGKDVNGRDKSMQAYMELLIEQRELIGLEVFEKHKNELDLSKFKDKEISLTNKLKLIANYMPPEPELGNMVFYVNTGYKKSHGDSKKIVDKETGKERFCATLISTEDLLNNPNMRGVYNYEKYLDAFNKRVETILVGFDPEIAKKIIVKIDKSGELKKEMFTNEQLKLRNFDCDLFDEAMHLEEMEVDFWNKTGYDPRLIWDGFRMYDNCKIHYDIYENALNYLNTLMIKSGKPKIKSINERYKENDLVLIKDNFTYRLGLYNGTYLQIIKDNIEVPKSEYEIEIEKKGIENEMKIKELEVSELSKKTEEEKLFELWNKKRQDYFPLFKEKYQISENMSFEKLVVEIDGFVDIFDNFIKERESEMENEGGEYSSGEY